MASEGTDELYSAFAKYQMLGVLNTLKSGRAVCWLGEDKVTKKKFVMRELATLAEVTNSKTWFDRDWKHWAKCIELSLGNGSALFVREWIEGVSLAYYALGSTDKPDEEKARYLFANIAGALQPLHDLGKAHGLIKPNNIILTHDGFFLTDPWMGDAMGADDTPSDTAMAGTIAGDPHYLSPECLKRQTQTPPSDVYSLACVLYEYLTGSKPFTDDNPVLIAYQHLATETKSVRSRRTDLSRSLEMILRKAMSKKPHDRFPNGAEFAEALRGDYTRTQGNLLPRPIPESDPFAEAPVAVKPQRKNDGDGTAEPATQEIAIPVAPTVKSKSTEFAFISVLELQRAMTTAQANPGASIEKLRELVNTERRTVGDNERIPSLFPALSSSKRLPPSAWANAPKMKPSTGPVSVSLRAVVEGRKPATAGGPVRQGPSVDPSETPDPEGIAKVKTVLWEQPLWFYGVLIGLLVFIGIIALLLLFK